ncbi:MAG: DNA-directed DNA polymerase [Berkelbacteria bacterium GW2011_GWA2_35_9]|uniref:DNA-directed DNA polymerase n=1 Tax=Berkelbacteria bacterium GW2011_GWA2_35_9 TaxID=1618333 RepID=A0A0G0DK72_9BACT|nr:MAG: DNA-directed DNA polymerase [Berkelbacteria bacterium GW2011_GWA2_35_9]
MDSYFASVEQQVQANLRGVPIVVTPYVSPTGCIISPSKNAKKLGIKTGMLVKEAQAIYPKVIVQEARPELYIFFHHQIVKLLNNLTPFVRVMSVDEMSLVLSPSERNIACCQKIACTIKNQMRQRVGDFLTCSIGIGPNQFIAKTASEINKPNGFYTCGLDNLKTFYQQLKLRDLPGINFNIEKKLNFLGIKTPTDLYQADQLYLLKNLKHMGKIWYFRLRGYETDIFTSRRQTVGHSFVLPPELREIKCLKKVLAKLAFKIGYRLRKEKLQAGAISLIIKTLPFGTLKTYCRLPLVCDSQRITWAACHLLNKLPSNFKPIALYLTAYNLNRSAHQLPLFDCQKKIENISKLMDKINDKYGSQTITSGNLLESDAIAPNRISFGEPK